MSNVVSPRGPLPPRVYWRRRLVLCAVVVGLVLLIGRMFGGGDDTAPVADRGAPPGAPSAGGPSAAPTSGPSSAPSPRAAKQRTSTPRQVARQAAAQARMAELDGPTGPLAPAAGPCAPADVAVVPDVEDTRALSAVPLRVGLSTTGAKACTFEFGSDTVALRVTSGDDLIWESLHCASAMPDESVVVRPGWLSYVTVDWSGRRGSDGCGNGGFAQPGYYWVEAAAIGGEPARSQFELRTPPPKPTPTATATATATEKPGDQAGDQPSDQPSDEPSGENTDRSRGEAGAEDAPQPSASPTAEPSPAQSTPRSRRSSG